MNEEIQWIQQYLWNALQIFGALIYNFTVYSNQTHCEIQGSSLRRQYPYSVKYIIWMLACFGIGVEVG